MPRSDLARAAVRVTHALALAVLVDCSSPASPCDQCTSDEACHPTAQVCVRTCASDGDCTPGHRCVTLSGQRSCALACDPTRCAELGPRLDCNGDDRCVTVACSARVACVDATRVCDHARRCVARDGECRVDADCPRWSPAVASVTRGACSEGVCRLVAAPRFVSSAPAPPIAVTRPSPREALYPPDASPVFTWVAQPRAQVVLVLDRVPESPAELPSAARWGAVVAANRGAVRWDEGRDIVRGAWQAGRSPPPRDRVLYLLVQALEGGALRGESSLVPFAVASRAPWTDVGARCDAQAPCGQVVRALVCVAGLCRVPCSSSEDCAAAGLTTCRDPEDGLRVCS